MILTEYDIQYTTQKAIKGSVLADHLAHQPMNDYEPMKFDFPDEEIMYIRDKTMVLHKWRALSYPVSPERGVSPLI